MPKPNIELTPVESSNIHSIGYDPNESKLYIRFKHGGTYGYKGVPADVHSALMDASSHGSFFHANIKDKFSFDRMDDPETQVEKKKTVLKKTR